MGRALAFRGPAESDRPACADEAAPAIFTPGRPATIVPGRSHPPKPPQSFALAPQTTSTIRLPPDMSPHGRAHSRLLNPSNLLSPRSNQVRRSPTTRPFPADTAACNGTPPPVFYITGSQMDSLLRCRLRRPPVPLPMRSARVPFRLVAWFEGRSIRTATSPHANASSSPPPPSSSPRRAVDEPFWRARPARLKRAAPLGEDRWCQGGNRHVFGFGTGKSLENKRRTPESRTRLSMVEW